MKTSFRIIVILVTILSCSTKDTRTSGNTASKVYQVTSDSLSIQPKKDSLLLTNVVTHYFSSPTVKDTFKIKLSGQTITDGTVEFEIKTNDGLVIHYESYPSNYLIGYGLDDKATELDQTEYIKDRIANFFNEENFRQPAISKEELLDEDYSDKETWDDIKSDLTAVKFEYLVGEESIGHIAYSKKLKKVVVIYSCC